MVGVPKSTGCVICRKRKIKCDETWPRCINCQKNGKDCPGPPRRHTFRPHDPRVVKSPPSSGEDEGRDSKIAVGNKLLPINTTSHTNGSTTMKFRIHGPGCSRSSSSRPPKIPSPGSNSDSSSASPPQQTIRKIPSPVQHSISRFPSPTYSYDLARSLIKALNTGSDGHRMSAFGPFIRDVPARIGHNAALDAAVACLVHAHSAMIQNKGANEIASPVLYLRAIQRLQACLEDPAQGLSSNTLCASVLLGLVEALAGPRVGNQYLAHVGGAGRLMELQGPNLCRDRFAREILRFNRGGIIITSVYRRTPCFLTSPEWRDIAFDKTNLSQEDCLYTDLLHRMADFPAILREFKDLEQRKLSPGNLPDDILNVDIPFDLNEEALHFDVPFTFPPIDPSLDFFTSLYSPDPSCASSYADGQNDFLNKLQNYKDELCKLGVEFDARLSDGTAALEMPSMAENSPVHTALHFTNSRVTVAYNCYWALLILTNKVMMKLLPPYDPSIYALESECRTVAHNICKTWEHAWANRPIGAFHTGFSFVMAHEFCSSEVQAWIVDGMNALLHDQMVDVFRWDSKIISTMSERLAGDGPDLVIATAKK